MLFYANRAIQSIKPEFWENYEPRRLLCRKLDVEHPALHSSLPLSTKSLEWVKILACPLFIKEISKSIVSAGKSRQLVRHVPSHSQ